MAREAYPLVQQAKEKMSFGRASAPSPTGLTLDYGPAFNLRRTMSTEAIWT
jgi:hypothetical protein